MSSTSLAGIYDFVHISPRIATAGQPSEEKLRSVANAGFETVINLTLHDDPKYSLPDEAGLVQSLGIEYIHLPVLFTGPTESVLIAFFKAYELRHNNKIRTVWEPDEIWQAFVSAVLEKYDRRGGSDL